MIDTNATIVKKTPEAFRSDVTNATVRMLPLVPKSKQDWTPGWCTYPHGFESNPDIEYFCGGENEKSAGAAACWRQGNLLHFGFEQSPAEMNETGQHLLLNCIAYISRFTEDRPIAVTPSVFADPVALPRAYLDRRLRDKAETKELDWIVEKSVIDSLKGKTPDEIRKWYAENHGFLHPGPEAKLEVDEELKSLGVPVDSIEFFAQGIEVMKKGGAEARRVAGLLSDYGPKGAPKKPSAADWQKWFEDNQPYLFFSDQGDYVWYIDPLAKERHTSSSELRGPARATKPALSIMQPRSVNREK